MHAGQDGSFAYHVFCHLAGHLFLLEVRHVHAQDVFETIAQGLAVVMRFQKLLPQLHAGKDLRVTAKKQAR